ncbi:unnamed protein product, partial [Gadus morhua 'NCC']
LGDTRTNELDDWDPCQLAAPPPSITTSTPTTKRFGKDWEAEEQWVEEGKENLSHSDRKGRGATLTSTPCQSSNSNSCYRHHQYNQYSMNQYQCSEL